MIGIGPPPADNTISSRRAVSFVIALLMYGLIMYGFNAGLSDIIKEKVIGNIQTVDIQAPQEEEDRPPPPPPRIDTAPPPFVPSPDIVIETAPVENTTAIQVVTQTRQESPPAPRKVATVQPRVNPRNPLTQPEYPLSEKRAEHTGTVMLSVYVLENGRVGDVQVQKSSGYPKLDEAAIAEAKRSWRLLPGTGEDGKPAPMWVIVPITFKLTNN